MAVGIVEFSGFVGKGLIASIMEFFGTVAKAIVREMGFVEEIALPILFDFPLRSVEMGAVLIEEVRSNRLSHFSFFNEIGLGIVCIFRCADGGPVGKCHFGRNEVRISQVCIGKTETITKLFSYDS